ncbi:MAG: site-specific integrase [Candidatus Methanomethylophilaceae archaeon]|nr:site-specific integrase [Candidatus Methanomethylophilaceae archaeon]
MGKYPFKDFAEEYLEKAKTSYTDETIRNRERRYRRMNAFVVDLRERKLISTSSPKQFTEKDVEVILREDSKNHSPADMVHEINALNKLCRYCGNYVVEPCLDRNPELRPKNKNGKRKSSMSDETYRAILERGLSVDPADFIRIRAYALVLLCIDTGTRNKEIRLAEVGDIDTRAWTLDIIHVKGEATYGEERVVPIREEIRPVVERYLKARSKWIFDNHSPSKALFPSDSSKDGFLCGNSLRRMKDLVQQDLQIRFDLRECRRTFGQRYIDQNLELSAVSVLMGHSSTRTTERFYGRQKNLMAIEKARETWEANRGQTSSSDSPSPTGKE